MAGLSAAGRHQLHSDLRALQNISPWPGLCHLAVRIPLQLILAKFAWTSWLQTQYVSFALWGMIAAICFASLLSLSHDALHHRLTGIVWFDELVGRILSWPIAWPIGAYKHVHLQHHRMNGQNLLDPERISPIANDWGGTGVSRFVLRYQLWLRMFVAGAFGLLISLVIVAAKRSAKPMLRRALLIDSIGIAATLACLLWLAWFSAGWHGVLGAALLFVLHERLVGITHQFRNHAEHYGTWEEHQTFLDTQYTSARSIRTNWFGRLYFNNLNRHAEHHIAPSIPFYRLEHAHAIIASAYRSEGFSSLETYGYFRAICEVSKAMQQSFAADVSKAARLCSSL